MRSPSSRNMKLLRGWITHPAGANGSIVGPGSQVWGDLYTIEDGKPPVLRALAAGFWHLIRSIFWPSDELEDLHLVVPRPAPRVHGFILWFQSAVLPLRSQLEPLTALTKRFVVRRGKTEQDVENQNLENQVR